MEDLIILLFWIFTGYIMGKLWSYIIHPFIIRKNTQEIERNPKWITPKLREKYYGFSNIDIITARSSIGGVPRFRINYNRKRKDYRLEFLIPEDTSVNEIDDIAAIALSAKLRIFYGLSITDKSAQWLSILMYMLDGGDINMSAVSFEEKRKSEQETS